MKRMGCVIFALALCASQGCAEPEISAVRMQAIYDQIKTPCKIGIVILAPQGKKVDCPNVFRYQDKWYMVYVQLEPDPQQGYTTQLAVSDDLLTWKPTGHIKAHEGVAAMRVWGGPWVCWCRGHPGQGEFQTSCARIQNWRVLS